MDRDRLARRVQGRKQAEEIVGLVDLPHSDCVDAFFDELRRRLVPEAVAIEAHQQQRTIRELSATTLEFVAHAGKRLDENRPRIPALAAAIETADGGHACGVPECDRESG